MIHKYDIFIYIANLLLFCVYFSLYFKNILESCEISGCLASIENIMMDLFISQKEKKLLGTANQFLNDIVLTKDNSKLRTPSRVSGHSLEKFLSKIQSTNNIASLAIHIEKLQVTYLVFNFSIYLIYFRKFFNF